MRNNYTNAAAKIFGSNKYAGINGSVSFRQVPMGVLVTAEVFGLPSGRRIFAFHIHNGEACSGNSADPFADAGTHFNPEGYAHPLHAGDLPPLFGNDGYAFMSVITDRFTVDEIIGRTIIIHGGADDFTSQPSGNSGEKLACGKIYGI